jgi:hypothetical protein
MSYNYSPTGPIAGDSQRDLLVKILQAILAGGGGVVYNAGNYGGSQPNFTPSGSTGFATDTSNGRFWQYWSGAWH